MRKMIVLPVALLVLTTWVPTALAGAADVAQVREDLQGVTADLRAAVVEAIPAPMLPFLPEARTSFMRAGISELDLAIQNSRVQSYEALMPILGSTTLAEAGSSLMVILGEPGKNHRERQELRGLLIDILDYIDALGTAGGIGDQMRRALGIEIDTTVRACPVAGEIGFLHDWRDPRGWRTHKGIDLVADSGTPLHAVEAGTVIQADYHWAGGNGLYLRAASTGDVYYYAHMSGYAPGVAAGTEVSAGDLVGWVGSTGNADMPHLHLGWMPGSGRVDLDNLQDPYPLVVNLCR